MSKKPDFFLSAAGEHDALTKPRACWAKGRLKNHVRDDYLHVKIDPPLAVQSCGFGDHDIVDLVLSTRHKGFTLFPITEWPSFVYIARITDLVVVDTGVILPNQVEPLAWGMIFPTYDEAHAMLAKM